MPGLIEICLKNILGLEIYGPVQAMMSIGKKGDFQNPHFSPKRDLHHSPRKWLTNFLKSPHIELELGKDTRYCGLKQSGETGTKGTSSRPSQVTRTSQRTGLKRRLMESFRPSSQAWHGATGWSCRGLGAFQSAIERQEWGETRGLGNPSRSQPEMSRNSRPRASSKRLWPKSGRLVLEPKAFKV